MPLLHLFGILLLAAGLRFLFLTGATTDDMVHLDFVRLRHRNAFTDNDPGNSVIPGRYGYPMLAHKIISLFPRNRWRAAGKLLNIGYDLVLVTAVWVLARILLPGGTESPLSPADMAALATTTSPVLMPITARMKSLGARSLGNLMVTACFLCLWLGMGHQPWLFGALAVALGVALVATSQFGTQALVLGAPFLALLGFNLLPLLVLAGMAVFLALAVRINKGPFRGLRDNVVYMIEHKRWYRRNAQRGTTATDRNRIKDLLALPYWWRNKKDDFFAILFRRNSYFIALYSFPLFWLAFLFAFRTGLPIPAQGLAGFSALVTLAMACVFLLTSLRPFSFLGQAERYFEYATPFASLLLAGQLAEGAMGLEAALFLLMLQILFTMANLAYTNFATIKAMLMEPERKPILDYLDAHKGLRVLTIPMKLSNLFSAMEEGGNAYYFKLIVHETEGMDHRDPEMPFLDLPCQDLDYFHQRYGVDTIIADKRFLAKAAKDQGLEYDFSDWPVEYADEDYEIHKRNPARTAA